jgi:hypothetical protein
VLVIVLGWLVLKSALFDEYRKNKVADLLTRLTRSEVVVAGKVSVALGRAIRIDAQDLSMPLGTKSADNVLDVGRAQIGLRLSDLLKGTLDIRELLFESVNANYVMNTSDAAATTKSAPQPGPAVEESKSGGGEAVLAFLTRRQSRAQDLNVLIRDEDTGFIFDFKLKALDIEPPSETGPLKISGSGTANDEPFTLNGNFPDGVPFRAEADFGTVRVLFEATPGPFTDEFDARLSLDIDRIEDLLSGLRLQHDISGSATLTANIARAGEITSLSNLESLITLTDGETVTTRGDLGDLSTLDNIDLVIDVQLYPDARRPKPARKLKDLKLVGLKYVTNGSLHNADNSSLSIIWNGFELKSGGAGPSPIMVRDIRRTEDGRLQFGDVKLLVGTPSSPLMTFEGSIDDALNLQDFDLRGALNLPVPSLLNLENVPEAERLGTIQGSIRLTGSGREVSVTDVNAWLEGSDLWSLTFKGADTSFNQADPSSLKSAPFGFDVALKIPQADRLLTTLGLKPADVANIDLTAKLERDDAAWNSTISAAAGESHLDSDLQILSDGDKIEARGELASDSVRLSDLSGVVATVIELAALERASFGGPDAKPDREIQPLVLNQAEKTEAEAPEDARPVEPLVMPRQNGDPSGGSGTEYAAQTISANDGAETVVAESNGLLLEKTTTLEIVNDNELLRMLDLEYAINIREVRGLRGFASVNSELTAKNGKARLGPLDFNYGGGHFRLDGSIDVLDKPDILNISGATGGWDIQKILSALRVDIDGRGILNARFDLSGNRRSLKRFAETVSGSAIVGMRHGSIDNTLIDLAGLGVLPWLFSSQLQKGSVDIVCLNAPLKISGGKISSDPLVAETRDVQLVAKAEVDLKGQTIYLEGRPRKVGQPLSRSPWPFTVSGPLAKPDVKLRSLPRRQWRSDGATEMPEIRKLCVPDILQLR